MTKIAEKLLTAVPAVPAAAGHDFMRLGDVLNYVRTHSRANQDVPTAFERQSKDSDGIQTCIPTEFF